MFKQIEGESAIIVSGGVYKVCDVYERANGELFAAAFGGFIRLYGNGGTSRSRASLNTLSFDQIEGQRLTVDKFGKLCLGADGAPDRKSLGSSSVKYLPAKMETS